MSFSHQISDYIEMSISGVKNSIVIMTSSLLVQLPVREVDNHVWKFVCCYLATTILQAIIAINRKGVADCEVGQ